MPFPRYTEAESEEPPPDANHVNKNHYVKTRLQSNGSYSDLDGAESVADTENDFAGAPRTSMTVLGPDSASVGALSAPLDEPQAIFDSQKRHRPRARASLVERKADSFSSVARTSSSSSPTPLQQPSNTSTGSSLDGGRTTDKGSTGGSELEPLVPATPHPPPPPPPPRRD